MRWLDSRWFSLRKIIWNPTTSSFLKDSLRNRSNHCCFLFQPPDFKWPEDASWWSNWAQIWTTSSWGSIYSPRTIRIIHIIFPESVSAHNRFAVVFFQTSKRSITDDLPICEMGVPQSNIEFLISKNLFFMLLRSSWYLVLWCSDVPLRFCRSESRWLLSGDVGLQVVAGGSGFP